MSESTSFYLVVADTAHIQPYIFGSNRLRENVGASYLVSCATKEWAYEAVNDACCPNNIWPDMDDYDSTRAIESDKALNAEVLYSGGGNFAVVFRRYEDAKGFTQVLSQRVLQDAPGLRLMICAPQKFRFNDTAKTFKEIMDAAFENIAQQKEAGYVSSPLLGLGVTVMCRSTGLPAVAMTPKINEDGTSSYPASSETLCKAEAARSADEHLSKTFSLPDKLTYPHDFDDLGRSVGEQSYIAVVHADGNGMGKTLQASMKAAKDIRDGISRLRKFSQAMDKCGRSAMQAIVNTLVAKVETESKSIQQTVTTQTGRKRPLIEIELKRDKYQDKKAENYFLPIRPIVFGGDDVTFVCDGRLGLALAAQYVEAFKAETAKHPDCEGQLTACAGVAIVKVHYPFARAYQLAEDLCNEAKTYRKSFKLNDSNAMSWHFALGGVHGTAKQMRQRHYQMPNNSQLTMRPVTIGENVKHPYRSWQVVCNGITAFRAPEWIERHNKVKALREALRVGGDALQKFRLHYLDNERLPDLGLVDDLAKSRDHGYVAEKDKDADARNKENNICVYFDAIELSDWVVTLTPPSNHKTLQDSQTAGGSHAKL